MRSREIPHPRGDSGCNRKFFLNTFYCCQKASCRCIFFRWGIRGEGAVVKWDYAAFATLSHEFDSRRLHHFGDSSPAT